MPPGRPPLVDPSCTSPALTPAEAHCRNVRNGFAADPAQFALASRLTELRDRLTASDEGSRVEQWLRRAFRRPPETVSGLYLWGDVGRGKTYLMDLFHETLPVVRKRRFHFHRFMQRVHADLRALEGRTDPLKTVAEGFAADARVLCFDEFFVSDIGDAMILGELLKHLFEHQVTLVATSNVAPAKLYENGLQRRRFLPAIDLIQRHTDVVHVGGETDYRLRVFKRGDVYRTDGRTTDLLDSFRALCHADPAEDEDLIINDRPIRARYCAEDAVWFDFDALCRGPRSQNDYIELARLFSTVVVDGVPLFNAEAESENAARRFISLVDEFYDRNVKVLFSAAAPVDALYGGSLLTMEFERTRSRIVEMQSDAYLRRMHRP
ncbi:MAG: AFG1 family ATPase [Gammaproteobacteria bacterium]|nr:AFG1 family ATPase [Gammaproteobacteria bacterium]MYF30029.1 AFG1 family ATPase [Gammaproteobacteria bacterium]MYK46311.1 AFG1 family ATPase [Gammaproteobacteria bacterium]